MLRKIGLYFCVALTLTAGVAISYSSTSAEPQADSPFTVSLLNLGFNVAEGECDGSINHPGYHRPLFQGCCKVDGGNCHCNVLC